jgi:hypothetical protein
MIVILRMSVLSMEGMPLRESIDLFITQGGYCKFEVVQEGEWDDA